MSALTVKQVAERFGVSPATVACWIRSGELRALNVGRAPAKKKPRFKVMPDALAAFELSRTVSPPPERVRRRRSPEIIDRY
jgi:excisionase family DNA binding protein